MSYKPLMSSVAEISNILSPVSVPKGSKIYIYLVPEISRGQKLKINNRLHFWDMPQTKIDQPIVASYLLANAR